MCPCAEQLFLHNFQNALKQQNLSVLPVYRAEVSLLKINGWKKSSLIWNIHVLRGFVQWNPIEVHGTGMKILQSPPQSQSSFPDHSQIRWSTCTSSRSVPIVRWVFVCVYLCMCMHGNAWFEFLNLCITGNCKTRLCVSFKSMRIGMHACRGGLLEGGSAGWLSAARANWGQMFCFGSLSVNLPHFPLDFSCDLP